MWEVIAELVAGGSTLLLTTQYLEEADRLADQIAVIDRGRVIASGTADELKNQVGGKRLELTVASVPDLSAARDALAPLAVGEVVIDEQARTLTVPVAGGPDVLPEAIKRLEAESLPALDIGLRRPTMDDVFLSLTGHAAQEAEDGAADADGDRADPAGRKEERAR